jgi:hypothetical protein
MFPAMPDRARGTGMVRRDNAENLDGGGSLA